MGRFWLVVLCAGLSAAACSILLAADERRALLQEARYLYSRVGVCRIYVINLRRSTARRHKVRLIMGVFRLPFHLVDAVDGKEAMATADRGRVASSSFLFCARDFQSPPRPMSPGEFGCLLSHQLARFDYLRFSAVAGVNLPVLVLEDDNDFVVDFVGQLHSAMASLPSDWHLYYGAYAPASADSVRKRCKKNIARIGGVFGTSCMAMRNVSVARALAWYTTDGYRGQRYLVADILPLHLTNGDVLVAYGAFPTRLATQADRQSFIRSQTDASMTYPLDSSILALISRQIAAYLAKK